MIERLVDQFPSYPKDAIYLDSLTVGLQHQSTLEATYQYNRKHGNTVRKGLHEFARQASEAYIEAKEIFGDFIGTSSDNIAWTPNSDYAWHLIINAMIKSSKSRLSFICSIFDHHSLLAPLVTLHNQNLIDVHFLGLQEEYNLVESIAQMADEQTVVALGHISPLIGVYRDISGISITAKGNGAKMFVDYSRSAGQSIVNIDSTFIDAAIIDGSIDLLGPQGACLLVIKPDLLSEIQNPFAGSGGVRYVLPNDVGQLRTIERFEIGNPNVGAMCGLAKSMTFLSSLGREKIVLHRLDLMNSLTQHLLEIPEISLIDPLMDSRMGNPYRSSAICFNIDGFSSHDVAMILDESAIMVRSGRLCSHPGIFALELEEVVQVSTHIYNTVDEIDGLIKSLQDVIQQKLIHDGT